MNKKKKALIKRDRQLEKLLETIENLKEGASTKEYDNDSALRGGQSKLPDALQKGIIDKTVEDREEQEEEDREDREEKNENIIRCIVRKVLKKRK